MNRLFVLLTMSFLVVGCGKYDSTGGDKPKGNPITDAKGPIGQGGDPTAMAVRRGTQQQKAMNDLRTIGQFYNIYRAEGAKPSADGFRKYIEQDKDMPAALKQAINNGDYVLNVSSDPNATGVLAYEKDKDYQGTRVVVMTDGAVQKTMGEAEFQAALKQGK